MRLARPVAGGIREDHTATLEKQIRRAAKGAVAEREAVIRKRAAGLAKRLDDLEKARRLRCGHCGKRAGSPEAAFCTKCGHPLGGVAKSAGTAGLERVTRLVKQARSADPAERDPALGALMGRGGPDLVARVIAGTVSAADLAKAAEEDLEERTCPVCAGQGRMTKPARGRAGRVCEECGGSGAITGTPDAPDVVRKSAAGLTEAEDMHLAMLLAKSRSSDPEARLSAIGELTENVGPEVAAKIVARDLVSPAEFTRAYLARGRQRETGAGGKPPRIPQATHVISADDFRRSPIGLPRQERPAPASTWPGMGGQQAAYGSSPGFGGDLEWIRESSSMVAPGLASSRGL